MKKNNILLLLTTIIAILTVSACQAQATPVYVDGGLRDQLAAQSAPFTEHILQGIETNDFAVFSADFDEAMQKAMTAEGFDQIYKLYGSLGAPEAWELINVEDRGDFYGVNYKVTYTGKIVLMLVVLPRSEPRLVTGLWFK